MKHTIGWAGRHGCYAGSASRPAALRAASVLKRIAGAVRDAGIRMQVLALRFKADSTARYLRETNSDGLIQSLNVAAFTADMRADTERADALQARLRTTPPGQQSDATYINPWPLAGVALIALPWLALAVIWSHQ